MTRGNARELAIHLIFGREFTGETPSEVVRMRLEEGYYEQLAAEYEIYTERPNEKQVKYLKKNPELDVIGGAIEEMEYDGSLNGKVIRYPLSHHSGP